MEYEKKRKCRFNINCGIDQLWDSIRSEISSKPIPESHKQELDTRQSTLNKDDQLSLKDLKDR
ncbi:MAG: addiction module protein [Promethearchaeia archaeon]